MEDILNGLNSTNERIRAAWSLIEEFKSAPPGVAGELVIGIKDFTNQYKVFETVLWDECLRIRGVLGDMVGINYVRREIAPAISDLMIKNGERRPKILMQHKKIGSCVMRTEEFLFLYGIALEKTGLGESISACYPQCGIPCGWNEGEGVIYLYHPEVKFQ